MFSLEPLRVLRAEAAGWAASFVALLPNILAALIVVLLTWLASRLLTRGVLRLLGPDRRESLRRAVAELTRLGVWTLGVLVAATILFPDLTPTRLLTGLGIGTIAAGLAFKDTFENFLAGVLILLREPMRIGDDIECGGISGRVESISVRDSYIRQRSGELILVPNSFLFNNPVKVLTDRPHRRITLTVGVAFGEDPDRTREVILEAVKGCGTLIPDQPIEVFATEFAEQSVEFLIRWWALSPPPDELRSRDEVLPAVQRALEAAGIEISLPRRDLVFRDALRIRTEPPEA